ncbi:MAG: cytochrome C oxidase subunit IV family protein [Gammaproteobacteria bacterium]|nr:cytochrome C oxidase subunit IV family protein [Gammaproteobacteria bacterium]MBU1644727.1 cytochrome C oxidase subunit IV family protein [Gammaproteobacteria bacterium]MBU1973461.1 cytochrome C oxidase subunit IV family protein [Gammaproteobacteria bacterium]
MSPHILNVVWIALIAATAVTWFVGETHSAGPKAVALILAIAGIKGWLVIYDFMALRRVKLLWRGAVLGWLLLVLAIIMLAYWQGLK